MEKLLLADVKVNQGAMQAVSLQRGVAVKEYLAFKELLLNRLFLGATKSGNVSASGLKIDPAPDAKTDTQPGAKWTPRAVLNIATPPL